MKPEEALLYGGFSLILGDPSGIYCFSNRGDSQHPPCSIRKLEPGRIYCLCNRLLDDPWPKVESSKENLSNLMPLMEQFSVEQRMEKLHDILKDTSRAPVDQLPTKETGCSEKIEEFLSSVFIESQEYGTRTATALVISSSATDPNKPSATCSFTEWSYDKGGMYTGKVEKKFDTAHSPGSDQHLSTAASKFLSI